MVVLDYQNRFRIWMEQVIPDRLDQLNETNFDVYYDLTMRDGERLFKRACKEYACNEDYNLLKLRQNEIQKGLEKYHDSLTKIYSIC